MGDRLLTTIIELEKTLQEEVCREAARAATWRDREFAALALAVETAQQQLAAWQVAELATAQEAATAEGARLLAAATVRCARLAALPDTFLEEVLRRQLHTVLPEDDHDHPHGQG